MHIPCTDADTSAGKTILEQRALSELLKVYKFFRKIKGLENLTIDFIAEETGVRETNRIIGEYEITAEEYINGTLYPDSVCYAFYPIDLHVMEGINKIFHSENVVAKVPYRALIPKNSKPVSYTHLDVYKRQRHRRADIANSRDRIRAFRITA